MFQTVLPALMTAVEPSELTLEGGTHNPWAPPFDFLERAFLPIVCRMGPTVETRLERPGFFPAGGGRFTAQIEPCAELLPIELLDRGRVLRRAVRAVVSRLPLSIAQREVKTVREQFGWPDDCTSVRSVDSAGPGNVVSIEIAGEHVTELFTGFGRKGVPAEEVASGAVREAQRYLSAGVPVGEHLADQLLVPTALCGGGAFRTLAPSGHSRTNVEVIEQFLDVSIRSEEISADVWEVRLEAH